MCRSRLHTISLDKAILTCYNIRINDEKGVKYA